MCNYRIVDMCKRNPLSGYGTVENEDGTKVAYLCKQHADMKKGGFLDLDRIVWTDKVVPAPKGVKCGKCKGYHATIDDVARCYNVDERIIAAGHRNNKPLTTTFKDGGSREWFATKKAAFVRIGELKVANKSFSFKPAANKNGFNIFIK